MILKRLVELYDYLSEKGEVAEYGWNDKSIHLQLDISSDGELLNITPLFKKEDKRVLVEHINVPISHVKTSQIIANFLCDSSAYILGINKKKNKARLEKQFESTKELHLEILSNIENEVAQGICLFFEKWDIYIEEENPLMKTYEKEINEDVNIIFSVNGVRPFDNKEIKEAWLNYYLKNFTDGNENICIVTGENDKTARIHGKIFGVKDGHKSGNNYTSVNAGAFESYGLKKNNIPDATVGQVAAFKYVTTLNYLLSNYNNKIYLGNLTVVYWSQKNNEASEKVFRKSLFSNVSKDTVKEDEQDVFQDIFKEIKYGNKINDEAIDLKENFYVLGLAPSNTRLIVRFFNENTFGNIIENINEHYKRMEIVKYDYDKEFPTILDILNETIDWKKEEKLLNDTLTEFIKSVLNNTPYPIDVYTSIIKKILIESNKNKRKSRTNTLRVSVIKAYLIKNFNYNEGNEITVRIDDSRNDVPYLFGRMFSVYEEIQNISNEGMELNVSIKEKFFDMAIVAPKIAFIRLNSLSINHMRKIKNKGKRIYLEKKLTDLISRLKSNNENESIIPDAFSIDEQGIFIIGYHQQNYERFKKRIKDENIDDENNSEEESIGGEENEQ